MGFILFILLPISFVILSTWLLYKGLAEEGIIDWKFIVLSLLSVAVIYAWLLYAPSLGFISGFFEFFFAAVASVLAGISLLGFLKGYRRFVSLLVILISPVIMFFCLQIGFNYSPNTIRERNGGEIALALDEYLINEGYFPEALGDLFPEYIEEIKPTNTLWGWLYTLDNDEYVLGYLYWVDSWGYSINVYRPSSGEWKVIDITLLNHSADPFDLGPTPTDW